MRPMKRFLFVRHAQASALAENYDQVSELGYRQARALGDHWPALGDAPKRIFTGTLERHRQTLEEMKQVVRAGDAAWSEPIELPDLNEHAGTGLVDELLPELAEDDPAIAEFLESPPADHHARLQTYFGFFRDLTERWAAGEFQRSGIEHWADFRHRVERGVADIVEATEPGELALVVTSGGPVAAAAGSALELSEQRTLELSWIVHNTAVTELFHRDDRIRLKSFNRTPHLPPELHTYV